MSERKNPDRDNLVRRIVLAVVGMAIAGIAVGFFKRAFFGVDPFQCFCNGMNQVVPIGFGTLYMLINAVLLVIDFFLDRHYIGISTFINLFLVGYAAEFSENMLARWFGDLALPGRILFLARRTTPFRCISPTGSSGLSGRSFRSGSYGSSAT